MRNSTGGSTLPAVVTRALWHLHAVPEPAAMLNALITRSIVLTVRSRPYAGVRWLRAPGRSSVGRRRPRRVPHVHRTLPRSRFHDRPISSRRAARPGRNGRRLPGRGPAARAQGRAEAVAGVARRRWHLSRAVPARVAARGVDRARGDRPDLRGGRDGRAAVHRDAVRRRRRPGGAAASGGAAGAGAGGGAGRAAGERAGRSARARPDPPRRQAQQCPDRRPMATASTPIWSTSGSPRTRRRTSA